MTEHRPRPHDHLVEPMFAALREHANEPHVEATAKRARLVRVAIWFAVLVAGALTVWIYSAS